MLAPSTFCWDCSARRRAWHAHGAHDVNVQPGNAVGTVTYAGAEGRRFAGWYFDEAFTTPADLTDVQEDVEIYARYIDKMAANAVGEAVYRNLYDGVDVKYSLVGQTLKEYYEFSAPDCILGEVSTTLYAPGLTPVLHDDGRIELQDDGGETIFVIPRPYMFDSAGMAEFNIAVGVRTLSTGEIRIAYTPDKEWTPVAHASMIGH